MDSVAEGEGGKIWENGIETCIISCMKWVASPGSMHDTGCLGLVHWDDPEGGYGEGGGFRMGKTGIPVADSFCYLAKLIQFVKFKNKIKKKKCKSVWLVQKAIWRFLKILTNQIQQYVKRVTHQEQLRFTPGIQEWLNTNRLISVILFFKFYFIFFSTSSNLFLFL